MSIQNGMSDTREIPVPKREQMPQNGYPGAAPPVPQQLRSSPEQAANGRQRSVPQSGTRNSEMQNRQRERAMQQPRQSGMQQQRRVLQPPPQAGIRRASWDGYPQEPVPAPVYTPPPQYEQPEEFRDEEPQPVKRKKKHRRRKHSCLRRLCISVLSFFFTIFCIYSVISILAIRKIHSEKTGERHITSTIAEKDSKVKNILLIGTDSRGKERGRADTIMLLSFSRHNSTLTVSSLMRDCYVNIPGHGADKLNAAYAYGGPTLLMDTVINNFGIRVDEYICINFKGFVRIADAAGGIKVKISDREAEAINQILETEVNEIMGDDAKADFLPSGGTFVLNGKQALSYARIRHVGNADFERTERQRNIMQILLNKFKHLRPTALLRILGNSTPNLTTNISGKKMYWYSLKLPFILFSYDRQSLRLPADGTFSDQTAPNGQMVLAVDYNANLQIYQQAVKDKNGIQSGSSEP
ncbi:MAG: LCP family protein [Oscillospiraceae bacterium]|nr:LCP family protein [Oscillospiraceae bacterium]